MVTLVGEKHVSRGQPYSHLKGPDPSVPKIFGTSYYARTRYKEQQPYFDVRKIFLRSRPKMLTRDLFAVANVLVCAFWQLCQCAWCRSPYRSPPPSPRDSELHGIDVDQSPITAADVGADRAQTFHLLLDRTKLLVGFQCYTPQPTYRSLCRL